MARIAGVDLPRDKRGEVAIQYIYGIGIPSSKKIFADARVDPGKRVKAWSDEETARVRDIIEREFKVEGDLRREVSMSVKCFMDIGSYRGIRHRKGLPARAAHAYERPHPQGQEQGRHGQEEAGGRLTRGRRAHEEVRSPTHGRRSGREGRVQSACHAQEGRAQA